MDYIPGQVLTAEELNASFRAKLDANSNILAPLASPAFTGTPTAPTPPLASNNTSLATTAFVKANATSLANAQLTGIPTAPTPAANTSGPQIANVDYVESNINQIVANASSLAITASNATAARTLAARAGDITWAEDYGYTGDGATDDGPALQLAINATAPGGLVMCRGTTSHSLIATTVVINKTITFSTQQSFYIATPIVGFNITAPHVEFRGPTIVGNRTPGSLGILISGQKVLVSHCHLENLDVLIKVEGGFEQLLFNLHLRNAVKSAVWFLNGVGPRIIECTYDTDVGTYAIPTMAGIWIQTQGCIISHCDILHGGVSGCLLLYPDSVGRYALEWNFINSCTFDSNDGPGIMIHNDASIGVAIKGVFISASWSATNWINLLIDGTGTIDGVTVSDTQLINSYGDASVYITNGNNIILDSNHIIGSGSSPDTSFVHMKPKSTNPMSVYSNTPGSVVIRGGQIKGSAYQIPAPPSRHIVLGANAGLVDIDGVTFDRNVTLRMIDDGSAGSSKLHTGRNPGLHTRTRGTAKIAAGQTFVTVPLQMDRTPQFWDISITPTSLPSVANFNWYLNTVTIANSSFQVGCNVAPTSDFYFVYTVNADRDIDAVDNTH